MKVHRPIDILSLIIIAVVLLACPFAAYSLGHERGTASQVATIRDVRSDAAEAAETAAQLRDYSGSLEASLTIAAVRIEQLESEATSAAATIERLRSKAATVTPQKAAAPKPQPTQVAWSGSVEQWRPLVAAYFPAEAVEEALLCIRLESGGNPNAVNGQYLGLFQMGSGWGTAEQRTNPEWAIAVAASSYAQKGWAAWPPMLARGF